MTELLKNTKTTLSSPFGYQITFSVIKTKLQKSQRRRSNFFSIVIIMCTGNLDELLLLNQSISEVVFAFFYLQQIHGKIYTYLYTYLIVKEIIDLYQGKLFIFIVARDLKDGPIDNAENHNESQGAEKSENIHFLAHFINIPNIFMSVRFDTTRINACNLNRYV